MTGAVGGAVSPKAAEQVAARARSFHAKQRCDSRGVVADIRRILAPWVAGGNSTVVKFQRACGVTKEAGRGWWPLHILFSFGAALGNETFFVIMLPQMFWVLNPVIGRRVILLWAYLYSAGQALKDVLKLPRPFGNGVIQLESLYAAEYGLPSTHAMNGSAMPFYLCFLMLRDSDMNSFWPVACALFWWLSTTFSRLYMGVHSPADIIVGCILGFSATIAMTIIGDDIDNIVASYSMIWWQAPLLGALLIYLYPLPPQWVNSPGDTALILGAAVGAVVGVNAQPAGKQSYTPFPVSRITSDMWTPVIMLGCLLVVVAIRAVCKLIVPAVLQLFIDCRGHEPMRCYSIELPTKFVTYFCMGVWTFGLVGMLF